ncbi:MAG TPA: 3-oxoacyl-[acyl-carrier-protein] synthase III C-terminal domain-containing protein [Puia sp.]|jgi:3-oxoacyl-[acyl-carrier-protein] synthase III|nr:3-oxoacyl-[acyl-carrier-protein] synthase III C-terminal domain-containing protein [Puia sp.]
MDKPIYIEYLDCYVPETELELASCPDLADSISPYFADSVDFLKNAKSALLLDNIRIEQRLDLKEMVMSIADRYMQSQRVDARTVKYIIMATDQSDGAKDFGHHILQRLGTPRSTVFRVTDNYCANVDVAIGLAAGLLRAEQKPSRAIIISGTRLGKGLTGRVVGTYGILGDSAAITVLSNEEGPHLAEVREQVVITRNELAEIDLTKDNTLLHLQSYTICLRELLAKSGLLPSMVDQVVFHNANELLILQVAKSCKINAKAVNNSNQGKFGHLGTCDLVLNLKTILEGGDKAIKNIVALHLGVMGTYAATHFVQ